MEASPVTNTKAQRVTQQKRGAKSAARPMRAFTGSSAHQRLAAS